MEKKQIQLEDIMADNIAKRLYVGLIPIDNLLGDLHSEIEDGTR